MRPDPQHRRNSAESGRIIYIGDVRKRRGIRGQAPDRYYLWAIALVAAMSWGAWLTVVMSLAPSRFLSYVAFFVPLAVALAATWTVSLYAIVWWRGGRPSVAVSARRAVLITAAIEINLGFLGARMWLLPIAVGSIAAVVLIEVAIRTRGH